MKLRLSVRFTRRMALLIGVAFLNLALCTGNENFLEFRSTAGPGLESGVQGLLSGDEGAFDTIVSSLVSGLFEIFAPDSSTGRP